MNSPKKTARTAGLLYFILAIVAVYDLMFVSSKIIVRGDAVTTANNMLANEFLFRTGIVSNFISVILFLFLVLVLYRLFKPVNEHLAKLMVALVIVQIPVNFIIGAFKITSLMILKGEVFKTLELAQLQDFAFLFLKIHGYGIITLQIFWGLWLIPFGLLTYRSGFIPRILGILLIINGAGYMIESLTFMLFQRSNYLFVRQFTFATYFGELVMILWLLIMGVKVQKSQQARSAQVP